MSEITKLCLGIIMILVGSLVALDNTWEDREKTLIKTMSEKECNHTFEDLNPSSFYIYKDGNYTCVGITGTEVKLYSSLSSSEAIQWAIDIVPKRTSIDIIEDIIMDGYLDYFSSGNKSYSMRAKGGHLIYGNPGS